MSDKIVILGGGMAAVTAAFALSGAGWRDRFESITIYQQGWRLGGKGASGRNRARHDRIEEHGLHLWLGFYENAFRLMRKCYAGLDRPLGSPVARFDDAFEKASFVVLPEFHDGRWKLWPIHYPENTREPGVPDDRDGSLSILDYVSQALRLLASLTREGGLTPEPVRTDLFGVVSDADLLGTRSGDATASIRALADAVSTRVGDAAPAALSTALRIADSWRDESMLLRQPGQQAALVGLVDSHVEWVGRLLPGDDRPRRLRAQIEIVGAIAKGLVVDRVWLQGFGAIDDEDAVAWLHRHGASMEALRNPLIVGGYDLAFAYENGDPSRPRIAAGQALHGLLRLLFEYKGAPFWRMRGGMGDVVFAPLYQVLKRRGVRFRFFHRVTKVRPAADGRSIAAVELTRQVALRDPRAEYDPLIDVKGMPCWPAEPKWELIENGAELASYDLESFWKPQPSPAGHETLRAGEHFDRLVFGISLGAVPYVCPDVLAQKREWRDMVEHVKTVHTQAFQLWLTKTSEELGGPREAATCSGFVEPFDTCADMRHLIPFESWPMDRRPRGIAYFCNAMPTGGGVRPAPDPSFPETAGRTVKENAVDFLQKHMSHLWAAAVDAGGRFAWDVLLTDGPATGAARFDEQFWRANVDPSERYVQSLPGTDQYRLRPDETGYAGFYIVGDWTDCGFNTGCIEAAVMSGLLASNAISGAPRLDEIVGYDPGTRSRRRWFDLEGAVEARAIRPAAAFMTPAANLVPRPVRDDGAARIVAMADPVFRNLWITTGYHDLAAGMTRVLGDTNLSWCGFATWASKTVGRFIRGELLPDWLRWELRASPEYTGLIAPLGDRFLRSDESRVDSVVALENAILGLFDEPLRTLSRLTAEGNHSVFRELGPIFARMVTLFEAATPPAAGSVRAFLDSIRSVDGDPEKTGWLRQGFASYVDARAASDRDAAAEMILLANGRLARTEQVRLQRFIKGALEAPFGDAPLRPNLPPFAARVNALVTGWSSLLPAGDPLRIELELHRAAVDGLLRRVWREAVTRAFMTLNLPDEVLRLGEDVPPFNGRSFPLELETIEHRPLDDFLEEHDLSRRRPGRGSRAHDWADLADRLNYIVTLFRSRQQKAKLLDPPFTGEQFERLQAGQIPPGPL